ncbi:MAG: hypothetical protein E2576_10695 [Alcaligenaceae bacterium]|nr:hypothetical protein [Alcaligenaceae bacterium SAGV5]MPS55328.1 hypothetical protein [Alcaligenaceae bacterium SAGV3]MPT57179.1 hypothetical protein [Alcaligenaceae bacterium]
MASTPNSTSVRCSSCR